LLLQAVKLFSESLALIPIESCLEEVNRQSNLNIT
jgi:hypothetical protein